MLIKLLAGIAINAVLASLLLPALAQEPKADAMQCAPLLSVTHNRF